MTEREHDPTNLPPARSDARTWVRRYLGWGVLVGVEAALIVVLLHYGLVFTDKPERHLFQLAVLGAAGAAGWIVVIWRPNALPPFVVLAPLPLLAAVVATALVSSYPSLNWPAAWQSMAYAGIFWLLARQASHPVGRRALIVVIAIVVAVAWGSYVVAVLQEWRRWLALDLPITSLPMRPSNVGGLALIPTWMADLLALGTPVVVAALWRRGARVLAVVFATAVLGAIVVTGTRSILLIAVVASIAAILLAVRGRVGGRAVSAVVTVAFVVTIVGAAAVLGSGRGLDEGRSSAYTSAIARISESPLVGTGPGTYGVKRMGDPVDVIGHLPFPDAHNIVLNNLAESGVVGLVGLLATIVLLGLAIRGSWRRSPDERLVIGGALLGLAIFAGHGMVDVVFALVGTVLVAVAITAIAVTSGTAAEPSGRPAPRTLRAVLGVAALVAVLVSVAAFSTERVVRTVADAEAAVTHQPARALELARSATASAPDLVSAWWIRMVAADAVGDTATAIEAARKLTELEGFGQQWISLAILAGRQGDRTTEDAALAASSGRLPIDPMVELNAIALLGARGETAAAADASRRLLAVRPDIEPILRSNAGPVAAAVAAVRADVARQMLASGDPGSAFLVALSGEDRALSDELLGRLAGDAARGGGLPWPTIVAAWFGDTAARASLDRSAKAAPTLDKALWSWLLAGRSCDKTAMTNWERAAGITYGVRATTPDLLDLAPAASVRQLPPGYPSYIWRQGYPIHPYVGGTWTFKTGRPVCQQPGT